MKAFLLAAGLGTRLRPITDSITKCLVPIAGRPLLAWWIDHLERHGVDEVLINTHHLPEGVERWVAGYTGPVRIHLAFEPELLGSAGTLHAQKWFVEGERDFYILYADNLTDVDLGELLRRHRERPAVLTMGLFHAENPSACGIVTLDEEGRIVEFEEKPEHPKSDLASAGIFVASPELFQYVDPASICPYDFGTHVIPHLEGLMNGLLVHGYLRDVGTHENLLKAERDWSLRPDLPGL